MSHRHRANIRTRKVILGCSSYRSGNEGPTHSRLLKTIVEGNGLKPDPNIGDVVMHRKTRILGVVESVKPPKEGRSEYGNVFVIKGFDGTTRHSSSVSFWTIWTEGH